MRFLKQIYQSRFAGTTTTRARRRVDLGDLVPRFSIYAIGDVHGCIDLLRAAEDSIRFDIEKTDIPGLVVLLGDYVDRGPDSAAVLSHLASAPVGRMRRLVLCGNHDDMFLRFLREPEKNRGWLDMGGRETLLSYGVSGRHLTFRRNEDILDLKHVLHDAIPEAHIQLLESMPIYARIGGHLFCHAGLRPGVPLEKQSDADLMWIREPFITKGPQLSYVTVHGHTPSTEPTMGPNRIGIDTGAYVTGRLSVLKLSGDQHSFLQ